MRGKQTETTVQSAACFLKDEAEIIAHSIATETVSEEPSEASALGRRALYLVGAHIVLALDRHQREVENSVATLREEIANLSHNLGEGILALRNKS